MRMLTRDLIPCWYELSWELLEVPTIVLRVHEDFIKAEKKITKKISFADELIKYLRLQRFEESFDGNFGFDDAFIRVGSKDGFVRYNIPLPKYNLSKCKNCNGGGRGRYLEGDCLHCDGTGKDREFDWHWAYKISASLNIFTMIAHFPQVETSASFPQLLTVETITRAEMHGGSLGGEYSVPLVAWLKTLKPYTKIPEMILAMRAAYDRMIGVKRFDESSFQAYVADNNGWLNVSCPGDACGLHPHHDSSFDVQRGFGYNFSCHNVDSPFQQLTLFAGLAALHDKVCKEISAISR